MRVSVCVRAPAHAAMELEKTVTALHQRKKRENNQTWSGPICNGNPLHRKTKPLHLRVLPLTRQIRSRLPGCHADSSREFKPDHAAVGTGSRRAPRWLAPCWRGSRPNHPTVFCSSASTSSGAIAGVGERRPRQSTIILDDRNF